MMGGLAFLSPWFLAALAVVPVLWWLLRLMPPRPRTVRFPAFFLLKGISSHVKTAAKTPWWILVLRSLIVIFFIFSLADPVRHLSSTIPGSGGAVLLVIDNGWASAAHWEKRVSKMQEYLSEIGRSRRAVILMPTASSDTDGRVHRHGPMDVSEAKEWLARLKPQPWQADYRAVEEVIRPVLEGKNVTHSLFLSDGTASNPKDAQSLLELLRSQGGGLTIIRDDIVNTPYVLKRVFEKPGDLTFRIGALVPPAQEVPMSLAAFTAEGSIIDEIKFVYPVGQNSFDVSWDLLPDMRSKVARISLRQTQMASTVYLADSQWQQHPVGILADAAHRDNEGFLNEVYYLKRALEANGAPLVDGPAELAQHTLSAMIWPDSAALTHVERVDLLNWVEAGGFLIRFAGPNLAASPDDPLLPVGLRHGQRSMQGAMTWEKPVKLGEAIEGGPFFGLLIPQDVTVMRQVLADPAPETFEKTWLTLEDGTPLVTGGKVGRGSVALIHTTAGPDWSDFCYSGLYVEILQRMVALSNGISDYKAQEILSPAMLMDGFGRLTPPEGQTIVSPVDPKQPFMPSPQTPPGIYGGSGQFQVFNLGGALPPMQRLEKIPSAAMETGYQLSGEESLKEVFFMWALLLFFIDTILTLFLRGVFSLRTGAAAVVLLMMGASPAFAADVNKTDLASGIYLAYIETGDQTTDYISHNGLEGLADVVNARTTIRVAGVQSVNPAKDTLYFYPFLYWPMVEGQYALSAEAARHLQNYMAQGGIILFGTRDQQFSSGSNEISSGLGTRKLREMTQGLSIPELMEVQEGHILGKSFYLLSDFPGRFAGGKLWVEKEPSAGHDGVTSVIIGSNDWAAAWLPAPQDRERFPVEPEGERQREMAYRFGVNLMMAALAGNYKADQVHIPYILERMGR